MRYDELRDILKSQLPGNEVKIKYIYARNAFEGACKYFINDREFLMISSTNIQFTQGIVLTVTDISQIKELLETPVKQRLSDEMLEQQEKIDREVSHAKSIS